jgi:glutathione S-transferase
VFSPWLWHKETAASTRQTVKERLAVRFAEMDRLLARQSYLMGERFTVADAYAFAILNWSHLLMVSLQAFPSVQAYLARVAARPKVVEALAAEGLLKKAA